MPGREMLGKSVAQTLPSDQIFQKTVQKAGKNGDFSGCEGWFTQKAVQLM